MKTFHIYFIADGYTGRQTVSLKTSTPECNLISDIQMHEDAIAITGMMASAWGIESYQATSVVFDPENPPDDLSN